MIKHACPEFNRECESCQNLLKVMRGVCANPATALQRVNNSLRKNAERIEIEQEYRQHWSEDLTEVNGVQTRIPVRPRF